MDPRLTKASKFLSLILRHDPGQIGLDLDPAGWLPISDILARNTIGMDRATLDKVVSENDKQRFQISEDGLRIRACQGHSQPVDLGLEPRIPPDPLFHGTARHSLDAIRRDGLRKQSRQFVHLSSDAETAVKVGQRHGDPVVLVLQTKALSDAGQVFYIAKNGVWLTDDVPARFITFPSSA